MTELQYCYEYITERGESFRVSYTKKRGLVCIVTNLYIRYYERNGGNLYAIFQNWGSIDKPCITWAFNKAENHLRSYYPVWGE